jgi:signal transduction histidine kinase
VKRLGTRLTLGLLALAVITAAIIVLSIQIGAFLHFRSLPIEIRESVQSQILHGEESLFQDAFKGLRRALGNSTLIGITLAALVAISFARILASVLSKPIERVSAASIKVAEGDLSARVPKPETRESLEVATLTQSFNQMADALETYENERRDMIASIAHDLRTPLSAMQVRLELLKEEVVPYSEVEVDLLLGQTELLGRLVNDLRTLSLADAGKLPLDLQKLELNELIDSVLKNYHYRADKENIRLCFEKPSQDMWVTADAGRMTQIFGNLLDNAFRVTPAGGSIQLTLSRQHDTAVIRIEDSGPGIAENLLPHVFDRFVQGKDQTGSSGLGLAIVKTLIELQRGTANASNRTEGGASFTLTLPI